MKKKVDLVKIRYQVIEDALSLESFLSVCVGSLLRMGDITKTGSLGYSTFALPVRSKIQILKDLQLFQGHEYLEGDLVKFFEIRNKFAHVLEINSFKKLCEIVPEIGKYLKKNFPFEQSIETATAIVQKKNEKKKVTKDKHDEKYLLSAFERLKLRVFGAMFEIFQLIQGGFLNEVESFFLAKAVKDKPDEIASLIETDIKDYIAKGHELDLIYPILPIIVGQSVRLIANKLNEEYTKNKNWEGISFKQGDLSEFLPYLSTIRESKPSTNQHESESAYLGSPSDLSDKTLP